jgi:DNA replication and repair protein RecF
VKLTIAGREARDFGSEGQQRTVALALKLAQGDLLRRCGRPLPVYLIDDVFGELDPQRRNAVMNLLPAEAQKLITTTNLDWWQKGDLALEVSEVKAGEVRDER